MVRLLGRLTMQVLVRLMALSSKLGIKRVTSLYLLMAVSFSQGPRPSTHQKSGALPEEACLHMKTSHWLRNSTFRHGGKMSLRNHLLQLFQLRKPDSSQEGGWPVPSIMKNMYTHQPSRLTFLPSSRRFWIPQAGVTAPPQFTRRTRQSLPASTYRAERRHSICGANHIVLQSPSPEFLEAPSIGSAGFTSSVNVQATTRH